MENAYEYIRTLKKPRIVSLPDYESQLHCKARTTFKIERFFSFVD